MRIISGTVRGRTLVAPAGERTRPTQDKVRESLFNIIRWDVMDARVLDLFAGTGALSLESLSRGAREAVLIDTDRAACEAIKKNIEACRMKDRARLIARDYRQAIEQLASEGQVFDVAFLDPPYKMENTGEMCAALYDRGLLAKAFLIVVEHKRGLAPLVDERFEAFDQRNYGDTQITLIRSAARGEAENGQAEGEVGSENGAVSGEL